MKPQTCTATFQIIASRPRAVVAAALASFVAMADIVALLQDCKLRCPPSASAIDKLQQLQQEHLQLFINCYGPDYVKPKHHYSLHIPEQMRRDKFLLDTFVLERKHRIAKAAAGNISHNSNYEKSVLARILAAHLQTVEDMQKQTSLQGRAVDIIADGFAGEVVAASRMQLAHCAVSVGEVLLHNGNALQVKACLRAGDDPMLLVQLYQYSRSLHAQATEWVLSAAPSLMLRADGQFHHPAYWTIDGQTLLILQ